MMRFIAALLLLLSCGYGQAASISCDDQVYWTDSTNQKCPPKVTDAAIINILQTGFTITGVGDSRAAGSVHSAWVSDSATYPPGCTSLHYTRANLTSPVAATRLQAERDRQACMKWPMIVDGVDATLTASTPVPDPGTFNLPVTGGLPDTTYTVWHLLKGGTSGKGKVSVISEHTVTTAAVPGGGDPDPELPGEQLVEDGGEVRYISSVDGNDMDNGLTPATAWARVDGYFCNLPPGTNIALWHQSVFSVQRFNICHTGLANDWNRIGSFKLNGASEPIWTIDGVFGTGTTDQKAELRGSLTTGALTAGSVVYPNTFPFDTYVADWDSVMRINSTADYTEVINIKLGLHKWKTIQIGDGFEDNLEYLIVDGLDQIDSGDSGLTYGVRNGVVRNSSFVNPNTCYGQRQQPGNTGTENLCPGPWGGGFTFVSSENMLMENSYFSGVYGEAFDIFTRADDTIVRGNVMEDYIAVCIYGDSSNDMVVENNICVADLAGTVGYSGQAVQAYGGIGSDMEYYFPTAPGPGSNENVTVRNNIVLNVGTGGNALWNAQWQNLVNTDPNATRKSSGYYNGNLLVGTRSGALAFYFWRDVAATQARVPYFYARNNVIWDSNGAASCAFRVLHSQTDMTHTHFPTTPSDPDCIGPGDTLGDPELTMASLSSWVNYTSVPDFEDARPDADSPLIGSGVVSDSVVYTWEQFGFAADQMSGNPDPNEWVKERTVDALGELIGPQGLKGPVCPAAGCTDTPAVAPDADAITISPNGKYFRKNGTPFNWIGCTAWLATKQSTTDITTYLEDRASRGCNVVHGPILHTIVEALVEADSPVSDDSPYTMNTTYFNDKVDWFVEEATRLNMNIMFPLCWGPNCKRDVVESPTNARTYANFIVDRYKTYPNIIWIVAGEYTKMSTNAPDYLPNNDQMDANELAILDALLAGVRANKHVDSLVTLHPDGWASTTDTGRHPSRNFHTETPGFDFNTLQSFSNIQEAVNDTEYDSQLSPQKPTVQDELFYEDSTSLAGDSGTVNASHVRLGAWQSRLSGSAGFTYGHDLIWYFGSGWAGQLGDPGAIDIFSHYKAFWDAHNSETLIRSRDWLTGDKGSNTIAPSTHTYETAMRESDGSKLIVYAPQGHNINVVTNNMSGTLRSRWYDPRNGGYTAIADPQSKSADTTFDPPGSPGVDNDWVLVID